MKFWYEKNRFHLTGTITPNQREDILRFEGRRYDRARQGWNIPASLRSLKFIEGCNGEPLDLGVTHDYVRNLGGVNSPKRTNILHDTCSRVGQFTLYPYQVEGIEWLSRRTHALLYDPPGLGKTIQAIGWALATNDASTNRGLIVCPKPVIDQWVDELKLAEVPWNVHIISSKGGQRTVVKVIDNGPPDSYWLVTNYEKLLRHEYIAQPYTLIVDESALMRNAKTQRTKAVLQWAKGASRVLAMTGSPVTNRPNELWTTFLLLNERQPQEFWAWMQRYTGAFETPYGWDFSGATHLDELGDELRHFALRREWSEVGHQLPNKIRTTIHVEPERGIDKLVTRLEEAVLDLVASGHSLDYGEGYSTNQQLRQHSALSKVDGAAAWIKNHIATGGGPVLLFSTFKEPLKKIVGLIGNDIATEYHGDIGVDARRANLQAFTSGVRNVLGITYAIGYLGLNLQCADTVFLLDPPWTPTELEQAEGRAWRTGQTRPVQIVFCYSGHPVELQILKAVEYKEDVIRAIYAFAASQNRGVDNPAGGS